MTELNAVEPINPPAPVESKLIQVDQAMLMGIIEQRNQYHYHVCKVMAALPILVASLPQIKWMNLLSSIGLDFTSLINPFGKKKKGASVSTEQLTAVFNGLMQEHPHLQEPISDLVNFYMTYRYINGPALPDGSTTPTEQQPVQ